MSRSFSVLYTKDRAKKRKVMHDGWLTVSGNTVTLVDVSAGLAQLARSRLSDKELLKVEANSSFDLGQYLVEIEDECEAGSMQQLPPSSGSDKVDTCVDDNTTTTQSRCAPITKSFVRPLSKGSTSGNIAGLTQAKSQSAKPPLEIDHSLKRLMRPHQLEACEFLFAALESPHLSSSGASAATGAILADEMGLGKSLTSIAVMWAYVRRDKCKCVVICPASLVNNWNKELRKWLAVKVTPICVKSGAGAGDAVRSFSVGHVSMSPILIVSYEMYRTHCEAINQTKGLDVLVCDEGHRLKNAQGTRTLDAFASSTATKRLLLSGTPIQNNLDELYSLVSFVRPAFLGARNYFKNLYEEPITSGCAAGASSEARLRGEAASSDLKALLCGLLLRRTQDEVLRTLLPARTVATVYLRMTQQQRQEYDLVAARTLSAVESGSCTATDSASSVLAGIQKLRNICGFCADNAADTAAEAKVEHLSVSSVKFVALRTILLQCRAAGEKLVVVSNFTSHLDCAELLLRGMGAMEGCSCLRIDGSVPSDSRQALIDRFNSPRDSSFVFLLSSRAGGVGISLIGASRLVMLDADWNPAVDHQAMARIWREGQKRPVFIYRLIAAGSIEQSILERQMRKIDIAKTIERQEILGPGNDEEGEEGGEPEEEEDSVDVEAAGEPEDSDDAVVPRDATALRNLIFPRDIPTHDESDEATMPPSLEPILASLISDATRTRPDDDDDAALNMVHSYVVSK